VLKEQEPMISGFRGMSPFGVGKQAVKDFMEDDMNTHAAALTYRILLAIFPFLIVILTLLGALNMEEFFDSMLREARTALSPELYTQFENILEQVQEGATGGLMSFGLILAIWAAAGGVRSVMHALNVAYDVEEGRPLWKKYVSSILFTIGLAAIFLAALALMFLGPQTMEWIADQAGLGGVFLTLWTWLRIPVAILLMMLAIAFIYYFFPYVDQPFTIVSPGAVIGVVVWVLATLGFSFYISNFGNFNATYGSLGGVIILLLYFYISSAILLLGAEVNAVIFKANPETDKENVKQEDVDEAKREARATGES
jgi:membrane protein